MKDQLNYSNEFPSEFNVLIRKFEDCPQKKSDTGNGYYIVSDVWGTCFHRIATKKTKFEVKYVVNRSYTKIPLHSLPFTNHCLVNFKNEAFEIVSETPYKVVGIHEPVSHVSNKDFKTQTFIVHTLDIFRIEKIENSEISGGLWIRTKKDEFVRPTSLINVFEIHFIDTYNQVKRQARKRARVF